MEICKYLVYMPWKTKKEKKIAANEKKHLTKLDPRKKHYII